jgi:helicase
MAFHGLFIGVDRHASPAINELQCAVRDAEALHALFADTLGAGDACLLVNSAATRAAIERDFIERLHRTAPDDVVVVTYSGHGSDDHRLISYDADPAALDTTALSLERFTELVERIPAKRVLVFLDCCFSGGAGAKVLVGPTATRGPSRAAELLARIAGEGRLIMTASGLSEEAIEDRRRGHGVFTHHLIEALRGAPEVTDGHDVVLLRMVEYVTNRVAATALGFGHVQTPAVRLRIDAEVRLPVLAPGKLFEQRFPNKTRGRVTDSLDSLGTCGLPKEIVDVWRLGVPSLNALQQAAINDFGLFDGTHLVVSAPTSSGKTFVGEMAGLRCYFENQKCVFLLPLKALVADKHAEFTKTYGAFGLRIVRVTGDHDADVPDFLGGRYDICLATYEKFGALYLGRPDLLRQVGVVVIDEAQTLVDPTRGAELEFLVTAIRAERARGVEPQLILLSAVLGETNGLERWLGARLLKHTERPVPLEEGVLLPDGQYRYRAQDGTVAQRACTRVVRLTGKSRDFVIPLVRDLVASGEKVIVFRESKGETRFCADYLAEALALPAAEAALNALPTLDASASSGLLRKCLARGVAFHNAHLHRDERAVIEGAFREKDNPLRVIAATTTLAMGVNTPASSVVVCGLTHPGPEQNPYTVAEYKNIIGRAGRLGYSETGKSFIIAASPAEALRFWRSYVEATPEPFASRFVGEDLVTLITRVLATSKATKQAGMTEPQVLAFLAGTFGAFQHAFATGQQPWSTETVRRELASLVSHGLVDSGPEGFALTPLGRVSGEQGLRVSSVLRVVAALRALPAHAVNAPALLVVAQVTGELDEVHLPVHAKSIQERARWPRELAARNVPNAVLSALRVNADERSATARAKRSYSVLEWVRGTEIATIEVAILQHMRESEAAGAIRGTAERTRDVLPAVAKIAELIHPAATIARAPEIDELLRSLEYGVPASVLPLRRSPRLAAVSRRLSGPLPAPVARTTRERQGPTRADPWLTGKGIARPGAVVQLTQQTYVARNSGSFTTEARKRMSKPFKLALEGKRRSEQDWVDGVARVGGRWSGLHYATSYAQAARMLFDTAHERRMVASVAVPCLFLLRHSLELALKDLAGMLDYVEEEGAALQRAKDEPITFKRLPAQDMKRLTKTHDLGVLLDILERGLKASERESVPAPWKELVDQFIEVERRIPERFRYPMVRAARQDSDGGDSKNVHVPSFTESEAIPIRDLLERYEEFFREAISMDLSSDERSWFMELGNEANHYGIRLIELEEYGPE